MKQLSISARRLWAKKGKPGVMTWLPLYQHMADAAGVARLLWREWLSASERQLIAYGLSEPNQAEGLAVFLAACHDLGKGVPLFQAKPRAFLPDDLDERILNSLQAEGLPCEPYSSFINARETPHALATQVLLLNMGCDPAIAAILGAHHGRPAATTTLGGMPMLVHGMHYHLGKQGKEKWSGVQQELLDFTLRLSGFESLAALPKPNFPAQVLLSALVIVADWIASNEKYFPYLEWEEDRSAVKMDRLEGAWKELDLPLPWTVNYFNEPDYFYERFVIKTPYPSQLDAMETARQVGIPGIFILEAPMGAGKTESALVAAEIFADKAMKSGVFFALPTQATSNAIFPRLLDWARKLKAPGKHAIRLAHGKAQFHDDYHALLEGSRHVGETAEDIMVHQWFEGNKQSLLADFVVGTIDQFLLSALRQRHVMLRHLGLAGKVVILDECHAYDAYMNKYLDQALKWMGVYRVPVIILSATLPARRRAQLVRAYLGQPANPLSSRRQRLSKSPFSPEPAPAWTTSRGYPLITWTDGSQVFHKELQKAGASRRVELERLADDQLAEKLKTLLQHGGYAGVMVNTVLRAQQFYQVLKEAFGEDAVTLIHSRFITPDRVACEARLLDMLGKPKGNKVRSGTHVVVGTQVIEQSLDLDFDLLVSDLCPMDLLLQRMGRLHRHQRGRPDGLETARCLVMGIRAEGFESGAEAIYKAYPLMRTLALLPRDYLTLPDDIPRLTQDVYDPDLALPEEPEGYGEAREEWNRLIARQEGRATAYLIKAPQSDDILNDWLSHTPKEAAGEASVRDSGDSVEVLVIRRREDGMLAPLPEAGFQETGAGMPVFKAPEPQDARMLARQSLRLPPSLCHEGISDKTIEALEASNQIISSWQASPWLKGQLFLILNHDLETTLCGFRLAYSRELGLLCEKEGGGHGEQGIQPAG